MNSKVKIIVMIAMAAAISAVLMIFDFAMPIAPSFMKMDISELPAIFIGFSMGPISGIITIILKNIIKLIFKPTSTAFVGELMNIVTGSLYVGIASIIYRFLHNKKGASISLLVSVIATAFFATVLNAYIMFPLYSKLYGLPMDAIVNMAIKANPFVKDYFTMMIISVFPFNLIKYFIVSIIIFFTYKTFKKVKIFNI